MTTRITRVYTRTGDQGQTGLVGGKRVSKDNIRVEAYGAVDELNSWIGLARAELKGAMLSQKSQKMVTELLLEIQQQLFHLGAQLATSSKQLHPQMPQVRQQEVAALEQLIDRLQEDLSELPSFILPGGGVVTATFHVCRTVCRRAERRTVRLARKSRVESAPVIYLNRLSDLLFVLARWVGQQLGETEVLWQKGKPVR